jgi:hypothetical protein
VAGEQAVDDEEGLLAGGVEALGVLEEGGEVHSSVVGLEMEEVAMARDGNTIQRQ